MPLLHDDHPFVRWWITKSGWHQPAEDWKASLCCAEGRLAIDAWCGALRADNRDFVRRALDDLDQAMKELGEAIEEWDPK